mmetsp:Transcript_121535/g.170999  ORF Transcript_121535/g.170999 Transcript_121535/m.170999 type:complete len:202 (+) Transcript_121535:1-606(+)
MGGSYVVVDGRDHLLGRLASVVAKQLLEGKSIVVVRCEGIALSGAIHRNTRKYGYFRQKRTLSNPKWGPFHHRAPSRQFYRAVRGMTPHKTARGAAAMSRLKVFDGCPPPYDTTKRMVVPEALRPLRMKPNRKYCYLGDVAALCGWSYQGVVERLEDKRRTRAYAWHLKNKAEAKLRREATEASAKALEPYSALLAELVCM